MMGCEDAGATGDAAAETDAAPSVDASLCPENTALVGDTCMDLFEAPNVPGGVPFVMFTYLEAADWCQVRGKRLCYDDEWQAACEGPNLYPYPYGPIHVPGKCNDDKTWRPYDQNLLNGWGLSVSSSSIGSLDELLVAAGASNPSAADHVEWLYQGEGAGTNLECVGPAGVYDLTGNVEEWTIRRDDGTPDFHGKLKGRYWAETRTCQMGVIQHGDTFRFYEIGFRCCMDRP